MKWFKHISDSLDDPFISELIEQHGHFGYMAFFGILEIYAREFDPDPGWQLSVSFNHLQYKLKLRQRTLLVNFLNSKQTQKKWRISISKVDGIEMVVIFIPKFLELLDDTTLRKLRNYKKKTVVSTDKVRTKELDVELELDLELNKRVLGGRVEGKKGKKKTVKNLLDNLTKGLSHKERI